MTEVLIIGGGVFGLATAYSLATGRYSSCPSKVLVIDRAAEPPEQDAASSDINKIVRGDYADPTYAAIGLACVDKWMHDKDWSPYFHQSGLLLATSKANGHGEYYVKSSFETQDAIFKSGRQPLGQPRMLGSDSAFSTAMNPASRGIQHCEKPPLAYINPASGWAWSGGALQKMYQKCKEAGVSFARGQVTSLIIEDGDVRGARTRDGQDYRATTTMLAAGSWSTALFPELKGKVTATGQPLATIQLSSEEAELYRRIPVYIDLQSGFYSFPPDKDNIVKFAFHHRGFLNEQPSFSDPSIKVSIPRTGHSGGSSEEEIPAASLKALRAELAKVWPGLAEKPIEMTRMCWYADSEDCDFVLSYHDRYPSLFLATGDSGHAFKFLPVIGDLCVQAMEDKLPPHLKEAWSYTRIRKDYKPDRGDSVLTVLDLSTLATKEDTQ